MCKSHLCTSQGVLAGFTPDQNQTGDKLQAVLRKSYDMLPSDQHRFMFLDAALMLRGCPVAHLIAVWEGILLLDTGNLNLLPSTPTLKKYAARHERAAILARRQMDDLHELSLINYEEEPSAVIKGSQR